MIKVIILDMKDGETRTISEHRGRLRNNQYARELFEQKVDKMVRRFLDKLIMEKQED